jgi:uncharacterized protein (TIRG00374 family)
VRWLKRGVATLLLGVALYLFWPVAQELRQPAAAEAFRHATWVWLAAAGLLQMGAYAFLTELNCLLLRPFEGEITFGRMLLVLPALAFIEVTIPSGGASGVMLRTRLLKRYGYPVEASVFTLALETVYLAVALAAASLFGIGFLIQTGHLTPVQLSGLTLLALTLVAGIVLAYLMGRDRARGHRWLATYARLRHYLAARFQRPGYDLARAAARLDRFYDGLARLEKTPRWPLLATAFGRIGLDVATLGACFMAFHYAITPGVLLAGYGLTLLLSALASLPGGLGLADISLAGLYGQLGGPGGVLTAAAAALAYRLIAFWLLRLLGFVSWQVLEGRPSSFTRPPI